MYYTHVPKPKTLEISNELRGLPSFLTRKVVEMSRSYFACAQYSCFRYALPEWKPIHSLRWEKVQLKYRRADFNVTEGFQFKVGEQ